MEFQQVLTEICKLSTMKATAALSKFLKTPVGVEIKRIEVKHLNEVESLINQKEKMVSLFQQIKGSVNGGSYLIHTEKAALSICDILFKRKPGTTKEFGTEEKSALSEVANIVIGNFLSAFAQSVQADSLMHCAPIFDYDYFEKIQKRLTPKYAKDVRELVALVCFSFQHIDVRGFVVIALEEQKLNKLLQNMASMS